MRVGSAVTPSAAAISNMVSPFHHVRHPLTSRLHRSELVTDPHLIQHQTKDKRLRFQADPLRPVCRRGFSVIGGPLVAVDLWDQAADET